MLRHLSCAERRATLFTTNIISYYFVLELLFETELWLPRVKFVICVVACSNPAPAKPKYAGLTAYKEVRSWELENN